VSVNGSRALVIIASRRPMHSAELAGAMALPPSNGTRICDRLVVAKLLDRRDNPTDWRHLLLTLTKEGPQVGRRTDGRRRAAIGQIMDRCPRTGPGASRPVRRSRRGDPRTRSVVGRLGHRSSTGRSC